MKIVLDRSSLYKAAGLLAAGVVGWTGAWLLVAEPQPQAPLQEQAVAGSTAPVASGTPKAPLAPFEAAPSARQTPTIEQLMRRQAEVSGSAARPLQSAAPPAAPQHPATDRRSEASAPASAAPKRSDDGAKAARLRAMQELQAKAIAEIQAVPPGDTAKLLAVLSRFDAQMQAAGAPAVIDMAKMRVTFENVERLQQLSKQLIVEAEKGRGADPSRVKALAAEIQVVQKNIPQQVIKPEVLQSASTLR